jgi:hypothetical protein
VGVMLGWIEDDKADGNIDVEDTGTLLGTIEGNTVD